VVALRPPGTLELALADLERALKINPALPANPRLGASFCARAQLRLQRGKTELALKDLARALELNPGNAEAHAVRGAVHGQRMDYADALADLQKAVELDPARKGALQAEIDKIQGMLG
jgi:tetratricopeptide (TPR) repeat protein